MSLSKSSRENGYSGDDSDAANDEVTVLKDDRGRSLRCYLEQTLEVNDGEYALLTPVDYPVEIFVWQGEEDDEEAVPVSDEDIERLFPIAKAVLAEQNLTLHQSAVTLTVSGELPDLDEEEGIVAETEGDEDYDELQYLTSFFEGEQEYAVYTPLDPYFILTRLNSQGEPELLSPEELSQLEPILPSIDAAIEERLFGGLEP